MYLPTLFAFFYRSHAEHHATKYGLVRDLVLPVCVLINDSFFANFIINDKFLRWGAINHILNQDFTLSMRALEGKKRITIFNNER